jgi:hypothetical protein
MKLTTLSATLLAVPTLAAPKEAKHAARGPLDLPFFINYGESYVLAGDTQMTWAHVYNFTGINFLGVTYSTMFPNGTVNFYSYFSNGDGNCYPWGVACALRDNDNRAYTLERMGNLGGAGCPGVPDFQIDDQTAFKARVRDNWASIASGEHVMNCTAGVSGNLDDLKGLKNDALLQVEVGHSPLASVISLF